MLSGVRNGSALLPYPQYHVQVHLPGLQLKMFDSCHEVKLVKMLTFCDC